VLPAPAGDAAPARAGVLELEELLSTHLNTRVKVELQNRRGRLVVDFATLEDLERIYRLMVGSRRVRLGHPASQRAFELGRRAKHRRRGPARGGPSHGAVVTLEEQD